jgi:hypothetical protein
MSGWVRKPPLEGGMFSKAACFTSLDGVSFAMAAKSFIRPTPSARPPVLGCPGHRSHEVVQLSARLGCR